MSRWVAVGKPSDFPEDRMTPCQVEGYDLVIVRRGGKFFAFEDRCSHMEYPLHDGFLEEETVTCAYHGAKFDIITGDALAMPAFEPITVYPTRVHDGRLWVDLEPEENFG